MPAYWLMKSEPEEWSWADQVKAGKASWEGVRNYQAANNMKAMNVGDLAFFYHTGNERQIVGVVEIVKPYHPDPSDKTGRFGMVDVKARMPVKKPVTLAAIKSEPKFAGLALLKQSRLSVMPIDPKSWALLCRMAGVAI
jgi:predicted RNA-binding protein with PUA-like domain